MKSVYNELYNRIDDLNEFKANSKKSKRIDVHVLRDIIFEAIKNDSNFLNEIKEGNNNFILGDDFLKDILNKRNQDYIISGLFGKEEQIKVSLISLINKLAHIDNKS
ncbi:MAG: hypothetical protein ACI4ON_04860 [Clostridia bacterium]